MPDDLALAAETIVRALAADDPYFGSGDAMFCNHCGECAGDHRPDCRWQLAVAWVAARSRRERCDADATPEAAAPSLARSRRKRCDAALNMARPHPEAVPE